MAKIQKFYEMPRGEVLLGPYRAGTQLPAYLEWVGNAPNMSLNIEREVQDHYAAYDEDRHKDFSIETMTNLTGTLTTDTISPQNLARAFGDGKTNTVTQAAITGHSEVFTVEKQGIFLRLGVTEDNGTGYRNISNVVITKDNAGTPVTLVNRVDYEVRGDTGLIEILEDGAIEAGDVITITADIAGSTFTRIITASTSFKGAFQFNTKNKNESGRQRTYYAPCAVLRPSGDIALVAENEFATLTWNISFEKVPGKELMYLDDQPFNG